MLRSDNKHSLYTVLQPILFNSSIRKDILYTTLKPAVLNRLLHSCHKDSLYNAHIAALPNQMLRSDRNNQTKPIISTTTNIFHNSKYHSHNMQTFKTHKVGFKINKVSIGKQIINTANLCKDNRNNIVNTNKTAWTKDSEKERDIPRILILNYLM